jgi:hypothetical protein
MDDQALTVYVHHIEDDGQSSSGIRSRRAELCRRDGNRPPLLQVVGTKKLKSGRRAAVHGLTKTGKRVADKLLASSAV